MIRLARFTPRIIGRSLGLRFNSISPLERYKAQLEEKAKQLGAGTVEELQAKFKDDIEQKKKELNKIDPLKELEEYERRQAEEIAKERANKMAKGSDAVREGISPDTPKLPYKTMNSFVDLEKIKVLPQKEIEYLWRARFQNKERNIHAIMDNLQFAKIYATAFKNPSFILPLPRGDVSEASEDGGYEMHFVQWSFVGPKTTHCMITTVAEYKLHKEYAKPHTTLMFHQDLSELHDLVLMNGQVETETSLSMDEASLLVLNVQRFYGGIGNPDGAQRKAELLRQFTIGSSEFDVDQLIKEASSIE